MRGLGDLCGVVIADGWGEGGDEHERAAHEVSDAVFIRRDADDAFIRKAARAIRQQCDGLQHIIGHDGLINVEFKMALAARDGHRRIISHDLRADHGDGFALRRVDFARHDRAARLIRGQGNLAEAGARAGGEEADVIRDFEQGRRDRIQRAVRRDKCVMRGEGFELIRRRFEWQASVIGDLFSEAFGETGFGVEARADRCATLREGIKFFEATFYAGDAQINLRDIAGKLLAQCDGRCVLCVRPSDLDDLGILFRFIIQRIAEDLQLGEEAMRDLLRRADVHGRRERVIGGLAAVHMIIRMDRIFGPNHAAENFDRLIRDDFVGVHIGLRARTCLPDGEREVIVELAFGHIRRGLDNRVFDFGVEIVGLKIRNRGRAFDDAQRADEGGRHGLDPNREINKRTRRLCAVIFIGRNGEFAERVGFSAEVGAGLGHKFFSYSLATRLEKVQKLHCRASVVALPPCFNVGKPQRKGDSTYENQ